MNIFKWRWIAIVELVMIPGLLIAGVPASDPVTELSKYARAYEWVGFLQPNPGSPPCDALLKDIQKARSLVAIKPRIIAEDPYDSSLSELSRCSEYKAAERREAPVPNDFIWGASDLGDQSFRMYRISPRNSDAASHPINIVYAEFDEQKLRTGAYSDGFSVVDLAECRVTGGVPVQRPRARDKATGAKRHFSKGLFKLNGRTYVITTSEQVGHLNDSQSFRAIEAWELKSVGKFLQVCAWAPKNILKNSNLGK